MKIDLVRFKVPVCFLIMTLAALAVLVIMGSGELEAIDGETTDNVQIVAEEEMNVVDGDELLFF